MKNITMVFLFCIILCLIIMMTNQCKSGDPNNNRSPENINQSTLNDLKISLKTDKDTYSIGDEIHFTIEFKNASSKPLRVLIDDEFVGSNIECSDNDGNIYTYEGGYKTWSPKVGVFIGETHLIQPNNRMEIKLDALVYDHYNLIFSNQFDRKGSNEFQNIKSDNDLPENFPDKYICAGRIFKLTNSGKYRFTYVYQATENDKNWRFTGATNREVSMDFLWIGRAASNTIELLLK